MKGPTILTFLSTLALAGPLAGQNLINSGAFFAPISDVRQAPVTTGLLSVTASNSGASANNGTWATGAGGLIQTRTELSGNTLGGLAAALLGTNPVLMVDAQLYAETVTTGSSLVFRRNITAETDILILTDLFNTLGINLSSTATGVVNTLVSANALYNWSASRSVDAPILAGQTYRVSFDVTPAAGLNVALFDSLNFGISNPTVLGAQGQSATTLDVLGILTVGSGGPSDTYTFDFVSSQNLSSLDFNFAAQSAVGANLLGGSGAFDYLTFSNMSVVAVPEPASAALGGIAILLCAFRRRR